MINKKELNFLNMETPKDNKPTKEDLQIKKLQLQIEALEEKKKEKEQKQNVIVQKESIFTTIARVAMYIIIAPIAILGGFFVACAKEAGRTGGRRR